MLSRSAPAYGSLIAAGLRTTGEPEKLRQYAPGHESWRVGAIRKSEHRKRRYRVRILILGARGQLGRDLERVAGSAGFETIAWDRENLDLRTVSDVEPHLRDLQFDVVVNCAAYTRVDAAETEPAEAFAINAYAVEAIARACHTVGCPLVHVSTDYVFDGEAHEPYRPEDAPGPINVYGSSKLAGEALARRAHRHGTIIVRTSSLFGVGGARPDGSRNFVETILGLGTKGERLHVVGDTMMAPTYSADLARGILDLLGSGAPPGIYHITNEGTATWWEFAREILDRAGILVEVEAIASTDRPAPARRPRYSVLDTEAITDRIGQLPSWRDALQRYLAERASVLP